MTEYSHDDEAFALDLQALRDKYPNVVVAYWLREEFTDLDDNIIDNATWAHIVDDFDSDVYDVVNRSDLKWAAIERAEKEVQCSDSPSK